MKCPSCKYRHNHTEDLGNGLEIFSDDFEQFIYISGCIIDNQYGVEKANLFACPKCGTVKLSKFGE